ncbi:hypothetical protein TrST_g516 [Triparma strigata]|uniref:Uncharacterized protein n=1 Tax=Triparma strigata TaxID=1606541 RepID=A0A9W7A6U3_9STRA|nr:hypothetical protein TrST_g516 [Triparma strigata]
MAAGLTNFEIFYIACCVFTRGLSWVEMYQPANWKYFRDVQTVVPVHLSHIRPLTFFTCSGHYLSCLYILFPYLFGVEPPAKFAGLVFGVLFGITVGFWVFVYDLQDYRPLAERRKNCDDSLVLTYQGFWLTDWTNHGPLLLMFSKFAYDAGEGAFLLENWWMPMAWGCTWLICIWLPFQLLGGDPLYADLRRDKPITHRAAVILKMIVITTFGYFMGMYCNKPFYELWLGVSGAARSEL